MVQTTTPVHGDLMVLAPGSCGAGASTGHVVVVDKVEASGKLSVVEQNRANRGSYMPTCGKCFLHVVANDGSGTTGGAGTSAPPVGGGRRAVQAARAARAAVQAIERFRGDGHADDAVPAHPPPEQPAPKPP